MTKGELRAIHRRWKPSDTILNPTGPLLVHTFRRADDTPLIPGHVVPLTVNLLPTTYQFKKGHRIRITLAGAANDHFQALDGPPPIWEAWHTPNRPSHIDLPIIR